MSIVNHILISQIKNIEGKVLVMGGMGIFE
jgi:hypothetical protein